jgi:hypothetical protein
MYLRDISVYAEHAIASRFPSGFVGWFHRESCCITELYRSLLRRRIVTPDTVKVHLDFIDAEGASPAIGRPCLSVVEGCWPFDFSTYAELDPAGMKRTLFDALHSALVWVARELGWDAAPFETIREEALAKNLELAGWSKKSCLSPDKKYRARVGFTWELRSVDFHVGIFDRKGREKGRKYLGSAVPEMGKLDSFLRTSGTWNRRNVFRLGIKRTSFELPDYWQVHLSGLLEAAEAHIPVIELPNRWLQGKPPPRIRGPRLANPKDAANFVKQVYKVEGDAQR